MKTPQASVSVLKSMHTFFREQQWSAKNNNKNAKTHCASRPGQVSLVR